MAMAVRDIEPEEGGAATASERPAPGSSRALAFGRAQRHSRRVRVLKLALPLAAALIAAAFAIYSYLASPAPAPMEADTSAFAEGKLVMAHPKLEGFTRQNLPYSMSALRAIQDVSSENVIQLEEINARLPLGGDNFATIAARHGVYDRDKNTIELDSDFTVTTTDGMVAKLKSAFLDIGKGNMKTGDPVDITRDGTRIESDSMSVLEHGKILVFEKRVRVNIDPAVSKAANQGNGESDAIR